MRRERYRVDDIEVDVGARRVVRGTSELGLAGHAFDLLVELIRRAPDVVSVEDLLDTVWPDVIVGEENVKQQVLLLRRVLEDDPSAPRYIANVRGRGYQLATEVTELGVEITRPEIGWKRRLPGIVGGLIAILLLGFGYFAYRQAPLGEVQAVAVVEPIPHRVFVSRFANRSTDSDLDPLTYLLSDGLTRRLAATGLLDVVPGAIPPFALADDAPASALVESARAAGATVLVRGQVFRQEAQVVVEADVIEVSSGSILATTSPILGDLGSPVSLLDQTGTSLVPAVAAATDRSISTLRPGAHFPTDLEAYRAYADGMEAFSRLDFHLAIPRFQDAAVADPEFAAAQIMIVLALVNLDRLSEARLAVEPLVERRSTLLPVERSVVDYLDASARLHSDEALVAARKVAAVAQQSPFAMEAARLALQRNLLEEALARFEAIEATDNPVRDYLPYHYFRSWAYHAVGLEEKEARIGTEVLQLFPEQIGAYWIAARSAAAVGDIDRVRRLLDSIWQLDDYFGHTPAGVTWMVAGELIAHGSPAAAKAIVAEAMSRRPALSGLDVASRYDWARLSLLADDADAAALVLEQLLVEGTRRLEIIGLLAVARARRGEQTLTLERAMAELAESGEVAGENLFWTAAIAVEKGDRDAAQASVENALREGFPYWGPARFAPISPHVHANPLLLPLLSSRPIPESLEILGPK